MKTVGKFAWILAAALFVLLPVLLVFAADPRAVASVAVSVSRVRVAQSDHVPLPNDFGAGKSQKHDATTDGNAGETPHAKQPDADWTRPPVLSLSQPASMGEVGFGSHYESLVAVTGWCGPCHSQENRNGAGNKKLAFRYINIEQPPPAELPPGWLAAVSHRMRILERQGKANIPLTTWFDSRGVIQWVQDSSITTEQVIAKIEHPDNFPPAPRPVSSYSASGSLGSISIRPQVEWGLNYFASNVRGPIVGIWDSNRNNGIGAKDGMPILHAKSSDYTCDRLMGTFGSFSIRCDEGIRVGEQLFKQLDITYKSEDDELKVLTSFGIKKAALEPHAHATAFNAEPSGIDPGTALTIFSILQAVWQMAHPELDLQLPGRMQATISVKDDAFLCDFNGAPRIRAKMFWEWMLEIDWVTVSTTKAHVEFVPQKDYWIQVLRRDLVVN